VLLVVAAGSIDNEIISGSTSYTSWIYPDNVANEAETIVASANAVAPLAAVAGVKVAVNEFVPIAIVTEAVAAVSFTTFV
jgi:hypothetical protein